MGNDSNTGEKTEWPTHRRLEKLRKKGQVAKSTDLSTAATLLIVCVYFAFGGERLVAKMKAVFAFVSRYNQHSFDEALSQASKMILLLMLEVSATLMILLVLTTVVVHVIQFGALVSADPIKPKPERINFAKGVKNLFSMDRFVQIIKSMLIMGLLGLAIYAVLKDVIPSLARMTRWPIQSVAGLIPLLLAWIVAIALIIFIPFSVLDFFLQKFLFLRRNRMSKYDVFKEYKEDEGDPLIKGQRRNLQMEMAFSPPERAQEADVVVVNPTHYAVAIVYRKGVTALPLVLVKGANERARLIVAAAGRGGVPVIRRPRLTRKLFGRVQEMDYVASEMLRGVVEVLVEAKVSMAKSA